MSMLTIEITAPRGVTFRCVFDVWHY